MYPIFFKIVRKVFFAFNCSFRPLNLTNVCPMCYKTNYNPTCVQNITVQMYDKCLKSDNHVKKISFSHHYLPNILFTLLDENDI